MLSKTNCKDIIHIIVDKYIKDSNPEIFDKKKQQITYMDTMINVSAEVLSNDIDEQNCLVRVLRTPLKFYVVMFNNEFNKEFDIWLTRRVFSEKSDNCIFEIEIKEQEITDLYIQDLSERILTRMATSCYPFLVIQIGLDYENSGAHSNIVLIEYSRGLSIIKITYFEPHGQETELFKAIDVPTIFDKVRQYMLQKPQIHHVHNTWGCSFVGIQQDDKFGMCYIFTRFWLYIALQLMKQCKDFSGEITHYIEEYIHEKAGSKVYNVITKWMYEMITTMIIETNNSKNLPKYMDIINEKIKISCDNKIYTHCKYEEETWPLSKCSTLKYKRDNVSEVNAMDIEDIKETQKYLKKVKAESSKMLDFELSKPIYPRGDIYNLDYEQKIAAWNQKKYEMDQEDLRQPIMRSLEGKSPLEQKIIINHWKNLNESWIKRRQL